MAEHRGPGAEPDPTSPAHAHPVQEPDRIAVGLVLGVTAASIAVTVGCIVWAYFAAGGVDERALPEGFELATPSRISGVLQTVMPSDPTPIRKEAADERLDHFAWVDREAAEIRIPIALAIDLRVAGELEAVTASVPRESRAPVPRDLRERVPRASREATPGAEPTVEEGGTGPPKRSPRPTAPAIPDAGGAPLDAAALQLAIGARLPEALEFVDETERRVELAALRAEAPSLPLMLILADADCRMLCSRVLDGAARALIAAGLRPGRDLQVVTIALDPRDDAARVRGQQAHVLAAFEPELAPSQWRFLRGRGDAVPRLARRLGFAYRYDERTDQFAHPAVLFLSTPGGRISGALYGVEFGPEALARGVALAAEDRLAEPTAPILLRCFQYVPALRQYAGAIRLFLRIGAGLSVVALLGGGVLLVRRRVRAEARP